MRKSAFGIALAVLAVGVVVVAGQKSYLADVVAPAFAVGVNDPVNNDGSLNNRLDLARLPVYTLTNGGSDVKVIDPGRALITGNWTDVGKTKGPNLRGLAGRAPYFHNGSAKDLTTPVLFYNDRFDLGLSERQSADLVAFLNAL